MTNEDYNFYKFLLEALIALVTLLTAGGVGMVIENKWNFIQKIKVKFFRKSHAEQSAKISQSHGSAESQIGGDNYGQVTQTINVVEQASTTVSLAPRQNHIRERVNEILQARGQSGSFEHRYRNAIRFINEYQPQLAASEYLSACVHIQDVFLERNTYRETVSQNARKALEESLEQLSSFVDQDLNDMDQLRPIIKRFEDALISLFPHVL
jgi:hypothetical protein